MASSEEARGRTFRLGTATPLLVRDPSLEGPSGKEDSHASISMEIDFDGNTLTAFASFAGDGATPVPAVGLATWQFA